MCGSFVFPLTVKMKEKRDMASYDIKAVILDNHVESSLPKGLATQIGPD